MKVDRNWNKKEDSSERRDQIKGSRQKRLQVLRAQSRPRLGREQKLRLMLRMRRRELIVVKDTKETDK